MEHDSHSEHAAAMAHHIYHSSDEESDGEYLGHIETHGASKQEVQHAEQPMHQESRGGADSMDAAGPAG